MPPHAPDATPLVQRLTDDDAAVITVRGLEKTYPDGTRAVKGVSFSVRRGEIFGLLGPNGAGKTSTMRILGGLNPGSGGEARVLGHDAEGERAALKNRVGFAMQEVGMDELATVAEMLRLHGRLHGLGRADARRRADEMLALFDLEAHRAKRVSRLSGGLQRRLDLAVSLIHSPEVLFLDEPSTGLDPKSRGDLWGTLRRLRDDEGLTILLSTHYMEEADALCDRIAIMSQGAIQVIDTPDALKRSLGGDRVRVRAAEPLTAAQVKAVEAALGAERVQAGDGHVEVRVDDGASELLPVLRAVADAGVQVAATRVLTPTLDQVFLHYTGDRLDGEPAPAGGGAR